jgi:hypothetical protein
VIPWELVKDLDDKKLQECCLGLVCFVCFEAFCGLSGAASPPVVRLKTILELFVQLLGGWWQWVFTPSECFDGEHSQRVSHWCPS